MTHKQALANSLTIVRPSSCNGRLVVFDWFEDRELTHEGPVTVHNTWYRCLKCNHRVVVERIAGDERIELEFRVSADYLPMDPRQMLKALAGSFAMESRS